MARITVVGNITHTPELKFTDNGTAILKFDIAENYRKSRDAEDEVSFFPITMFGDLAEHVAATCPKGSRIIVEGRMKMESWTGKDGNNKTKLAIVADSVGAELRFQTGEMTAGVKRGEAKPAPRERTNPAVSRDYDSDPF